MRPGLAAACLGLSAGCAPSPALFVDRIEGGWAVVIAPDGGTTEVPSALLGDAGEGALLGGDRGALAARVGALRRMLARDDTGADLDLDPSGRAR